MKLSQFRFKLPEEQVALYPPHRAFENEDGTVDRIYNRDQCRLMVLHRKRQTIEMFQKDADGNATDNLLYPAMNDRGYDWWLNEGKLVVEEPAYCASVSAKMSDWIDGIVSSR